MIVTDKNKLTTPCEVVSLKEGEDIAANLLQELRQTNGIGIAANQIGINKRVCIVNVPTANNTEPIILINPRIIVTLGKYALLHFRPTGKISEDHGKMLIWNKRILYPVYHPAAALRNKNILQSLELDLKKIPEILLLTLSKEFKKNA